MTTKTKIDTFTSSGTWICPAGVTGILATLVGGGGGTYGNNVGGSNPSPGTGGAGSGEILIGVPMKVIPGNSYTVTVGAGGLGTARDVAPPAAGNTTFNGFNALGSPGFPSGTNSQEYNGGTGGGWGGNEGFAGGGYPPFANGRSPSHTTGGKGKRECRWGTGGNRGAMGSRASGPQYVTSANAEKTESSDGNSTPAPVDWSCVAGVLGGLHSFNGLKDPANAVFGGGGAGGGTIYGGNMGGDYNQNVGITNTAHYGSGAPGAGAQQGSVHSSVNGANGAPGVVQIMYIA